MSIPFMRPIQQADFKEIHDLAMLTGGGMTNLPMDKNNLQARINFSLESFAKQAEEPGGEVYILALEKEGHVIGVSALFASIGLDSGFVNYRVNTMFHFSEQLGKRISRRLLIPSHDFTGASEVGSLFLSPTARGGGYGKLLSRSRFMFIAQKPTIFADEICAELRGWRDEEGGQPFWDAIGQHFFDMDFEAADQHNSLAGNQFIADLMPAYPIYVALLPEKARECIGKPHESGVYAYKMLLEEGFENKGYIDIFDAGPVVNTRISNLKCIKNSARKKAIVSDNVGASQEYLLASGVCAEFRCARGEAAIKGDDVVITPEMARVLNIDHGSDICISPW